MTLENQSQTPESQKKKNAPLNLIPISRLRLFSDMKDATENCRHVDPKMKYVVSE